MPDDERVSEMKRCGKLREIIRVGGPIVASPGLTGSSMTTTVMGNGAIAIGGYKEHLIVPGVGIERPAVAEDDGLPRAPILVKNGRAVPGGNGARTHRGKSSSQDQPLCHSFSAVTQFSNYFFRRDHREKQLSSILSLSST